MKITEINEINENLLTKYGSRAAERFGGGAEKAAAKELSKADKLAQAASTPPPVTSNVPKNLQGDPISVSPPATATPLRIMTIGSVLIKKKNRLISRGQKHYWHEPKESGKDGGRSYTG